MAFSRSICGVPTITTDLAGFGLWVSDMPQSIEKGVAVLHRTDYMEAELIVELRDNLLIYLNASKEQRKQIATRVSRIAKHALWEEFYQYYKEAYDIALGNVRNGDCK